MIGLHVKVESPLTRMEGQKKLESMIFILILIFKKWPLQVAPLLKSIGQTLCSLFQQIAKKKKCRQERKKKSKLDFRKGHSGQRT